MINQTEDKLDIAQIEVYNLENIYANLKDSIEREKIEDKIYFEQSRIQTMDIDLNDLNL